MTTTIAFTVYGKSETKGSTKSFISNTTGAIVTKNDNPMAKGWALRIGIEASIAMRGRAHVAGAVALTVAFYLHRPKSLKKAQQYHIRKPDLDKILRCAKDALTGIVWLDDSQVVACSASKVYAGGILDPLGPAGRLRAEITVSPAAELERSA